jgi:hypothetical protein
MPILATIGRFSGVILETYSVHLVLRFVVLGPLPIATLFRFPRSPTGFLVICYRESMV